MAIEWTRQEPVKCRLRVLEHAATSPATERDATPEDLRAAGWMDADILRQTIAERDTARKYRYAAETERDAARAEVERLGDEVKACHDALSCAGVSNVGELLRDRIARAMSDSRAERLLAQRDDALAEVERLTRDLESARIGAATIAAQEAASLAGGVPGRCT